jgi:hypothetical protein
MGLNRDTDTVGEFKNRSLGGDRPIGISTRSKQIPTGKQLNNFARVPII